MVKVIVFIFLVLNLRATTMRKTYSCERRQLAVVPRHQLSRALLTSSARIGLQRLFRSLSVKTQECDRRSKGRRNHL